MYYCGIQVVSKKLEDWTVDDLQEFLYRNSDYLRENGLSELADDVDLVSRNLESICHDKDMEQELTELTERNDDLDSEISDLNKQVEALECQVESLEDVIAELEEQLADNEA